MLRMPESTTESRNGETNGSGISRMGISLVAFELTKRRTHAESVAMRSITLARRFMATRTQYWKVLRMAPTQSRDPAAPLRSSALRFELYQRLGQRYAERCWNQARLICEQRFLS